MASRFSNQSPNNKPNAATPPPQPQERLEGLVRLLTRFQRFAWDIGGVFCLALALMTLLALLTPRLTGRLLDWWASFLRVWFGWGAYWTILALGTGGVWMLRRRGGPERSRPPWGRVLMLEGAAFTSMTLLAVLGDVSLVRAEAGLDGGRIGWGLAELLRRLFGSLGLLGVILQILILVLLLLVFLALGLGLLKPFLKWLQRASRAPKPAEFYGQSPVVSEAPLAGMDSTLEPAESLRRRRPFLPSQFRKSFQIQEDEDDRASAPPPRDERLPSLDLLVIEQSSRPSERNINLTAGLIEKTLAEFGIPAKVVGFQVGPTVTQFALEPGYVEKEKNGEDGEPDRQKVRVSQISSLGRDLALALAAERLRIQAPVPGRPYVGVEVPNARSTVVRLRPILESESFFKISSPLTIALGRDVSGRPVAADLAAMPHLLIAGTTGSGKSVCIAALTTCLVMNNTPEDLRLVMIDPKMVELVRFNGLPHLFGKVETDLDRILGVLRWTVAEMDRRYKVLEETRSRNIDTYNRKARRRRAMQPMPRIVVMIDELADLMMSAPDQTEHNLVRLAQMARATGIHLVVATQRPSTDVVTGLIKANFPARLSFAVASSVDSRVILDMVGAEALLGRGDMLFLPPEASAPARLQGVMVTDQEVERVITFWQKAMESVPAETEPPWEEMIAQEEMLADRDDLIEKAIAIVRRERRASASMLQRRLHVGYPRAARLVDELEDLGVIGPAVGGGREREVLIEEDEGDGL
jgi:S-DNA-T family DNA segregation ATPase FtsK/SpoIIIE